MSANYGTVQENGVVTVEVGAVKPVVQRMYGRLEPYLPHFGYKQNREHVVRYMEGQVSELPRRTAEPIARRTKTPRRNMQRFVGENPWDEEAILDHVSSDVAQELGDPEALLIPDGSGFPKKGTESVGVARQWCGRLGKEENCQVGQFLTYASSKGHALVDRRLYLPEEWANDPVRRAKCHVPESVVFRKGWELADEMIAARSPELPHAAVVADDEYGRVKEFRDRLRERGENYALEVPHNTVVIDIRQKPSPGRFSDPVPASVWARRKEASAWQIYTVRNGTQGPMQIQVAWTRVLTEREDKRLVEELLLVVRTLSQKPETKYFLCHRKEGIDLPKIIRWATGRWPIEDCIERAKGQVGMDEYEVRSWVGWHHQMTLAIMTLLFLTLEAKERKEAFSPLDRRGDAIRAQRGVAPQASAYTRRLARYRPRCRRDPHSQRAKTTTRLRQSATPFATGTTRH